MTTTNVGLLRIYDGVSIQQGGQSGRESLAVGSRTTPVRTLSARLDYMPMIRTITLEPGETARVWSASNENLGGFLHARIQTIGTGIVKVGTWQDTPTSTSDLRPSGAYGELQDEYVMSHDVWKRSTHEVEINPTAAKRRTKDAGGVPALMNDAANVPGRIYEIWAHNPSTTSRVSFRFSIAGPKLATLIGGGVGPSPTWTPFTVLVKWQGAPEYWVDSTSGNDTNPGTEAQPLATIAEAGTRLNFPSGTIRRGGGIVYIRRGRVYTNDTLNGKPDGVGQRHLYGGSAGQPLIYTTYGTGARPIIEPPINVPALQMSGMTGSQGNCGEIRCYGLHIRGQLNGSSQHSTVGVSVTGTNGPLYLEDCRIQRTVSGVNLNGESGRVIGFYAFRCIIDDTRSVSSHAPGIYGAAVSDAEVRECVFNNIGNADTFSQCMYWVHDAVTPNQKRVIDCIAWDPTGFAFVQCRGGDYVVTGNLAYRCGNGIGIGHPMALQVQTRGTFSRNWIINPDSPTWGISYQRCDGALIEDNRVYTANSGLGLFGGGGTTPPQPVGTFSLNNNVVKAALTVTTATETTVQDRLVNRAPGVWGQEYTAAYVANEIGGNT